MLVGTVIVNFPLLKCRGSSSERNSCAVAPVTLHYSRPRKYENVGTPDVLSIAL